MRIAEALLEREILDGNEVMQLINSQPLPPLPPGGPRIPRTTRSRCCGPKARRGGCRGSRKGSGPSRRDETRQKLENSSQEAGLDPGLLAFSVVEVPPFPVYLFDIDGTLLDSARDICGAVEQVLAGTGCRPVTFDYLRSFIGLHLTTLFQDVFPESTPEQIDGLSTSTAHSTRRAGTS